uniref:Integrase catalytic domain-containing protein n=1 Tax=Rhodnius prolixus TaxID=13249 RepID=T1HB46_RHOPR
MGGSIDSNATIQKIRETMARFGIPKVLVTDNGPQFTSQAFQDFCSINGIRKA